MLKRKNDFVAILMSSRRQALPAHAPGTQVLVGKVYLPSLQLKLMKLPADADAVLGMEQLPPHKSLRILLQMLMFHGR